jgi:hypothetical protein
MERDVNVPEADDERMQGLIEKLATLRVDGPGRGGPHTGIVHNDVTRELLTFGKKVVPFLVARLPDSGFDEAVYTIFLLRELRAIEARPAVLELQSQIDQRSAGRDFTLRMQVEYFLRDTQELIEG